MGTPVSLAQMAEPIAMPHITWERALAPPGEYDGTIRARRRCALVSHYFDHSLFVVVS